MRKNPGVVPVLIGRSFESDILSSLLILAAVSLVSFHGVFLTQFIVGSYSHFILIEVSLAAFTNGIYRPVYYDSLFL